VSDGPEAGEEREPRDRAALWRPIREAIAALGASDPKRLRFGAAAHRYELRPTLSDLRIAEIEAAAGVRLPDDYRDFLLEVGDGGAGPCYGLVPFDQREQLALMQGVFSPSPPTAPSASTPSGSSARPTLLLPWNGVILLSHLGCGYLAYLVVEGPHRGEVWLDVGGNGSPRSIAPHFIAFYTDWLTALRRNEWPATHVKPGSCALALALSGYLGHIERQLGREAGALTDVELRGALASLGPGAIKITAETRSLPSLAPDFPSGFPSGFPVVDPCLACERMLLELGNLGLQRASISPGAAVGFPAPQ
jgi:hypothetical protein